MDNIYFVHLYLNKQNNCLTCTQKSTNSLDHMIFLNKLILLPLLWVPVFFTSPNRGLTTIPINGYPATKATQTSIIKAPGSAPVGNVCAALQDKQGNTWFVTTGKGAYRYDGKSFTNFTTGDGLISDQIFSIAEDKQGNLWFGTDAGVSRYDGKTFTEFALPGTFVTSILVHKSGKLWFATRDGVYCYDGKAVTRLLDNRQIINQNGIALKVVQQMLEDKKGVIWITTKDEGICRYDGKSIVNYTPYNQLWFRGLLQDKNGAIWAGGKTTGLCRYDGKTFSRVLSDDKLDSYNIYSIMEDQSGKIWVGTEAENSSARDTEGGVWVYDGKSFKNFLKQDGLSHNAVWSISEDAAGRFWFGTRRGLSWYDGKTFTSLLK